MRALAAGLVAAWALVALPACNNCGTYQYKGLSGTEWCGTVYGTQGSHYEVDNDPEAAFVEILFDHSVPPGEFDFENSGGAAVKLLWSDLESKDPLMADRVLVTCFWTDFGDPFNEQDNLYYGEPATEFELEGHGGRLNLDVGNAFVREVSWNVVCGDGVIHLEGKDTIGFERLETSSADSDLMAHLEASAGEPDGR